MVTGHPSDTVTMIRCKQNAFGCFFTGPSAKCTFEMRPAKSRSSTSMREWFNKTHCELLRNLELARIIKDRCWTPHSNTPSQRQHHRPMPSELKRATLTIPHWIIYELPSK